MINDWSLMKKLIWLKKGVLSGSEAWTTISGAIVEFITQRAHKLKSCVVSLSPQQDLHGYDSPWPEGGGVNKLPPAASFEPIVVGDATLTPYADGHYHLSKVAGSNPSSFIVNLAKSVDVTTSQYIRYISTGNSGNMIANLRDGNGNTLNGGYWGKPSANISNAGTATNFNFYFTSSVAGEYDLYPIISNSPVGTYSPYSNICPISGWTEANVTRTGKNLAPATTFSAKHDTVITFNPPLPVGTYSYSYSATRTGSLPYNGSFRFIYDDNTYINEYLFVSSSRQVRNGIEFTKPLKSIYVYSISGSYAESSNYTVTCTDFQLELGSTATDYEPFRGNSYSVTFGKTVYGATPDIVSGEMPINKRYVDLGTLDWSIASTNTAGKHRYMVTVPDTVNIDGNETADIVCEILKPTSPNRTYTMYEDGISNNIANHQIAIYMAQYEEADLETFKAAMSGVYAAYPLETPIEAAITPTPITALKGYNAIWSDGDSIEVTVHGTPVEVSTQQALNMLLGGAYHNDQTADDVSDEEALDIILGGEQR